MALTSRQRARIPTRDFADPQNRKYPLDTASRARSAIRFFSIPRYAAEYTLTKQKRMWKKMLAAAQDFDVHVSAIAGPPWLQKDRVAGSWQRAKGKKMTTRRRRTKKRRTTYYVVPDESNQGGRTGWDKLRWAVKKQKAKQASRRTRTQAEAIEIAKRLAQRDGNGKVMVQGRRGMFTHEFTYGNDPRGSKG